MAKDTVVQYVLKVDSQSAEKGLDRTGKEAQQTSKQLDRLSQTNVKASKTTQQLAKSQGFATKQARNLRRAGRDLDGAFADVAQGVGLLNADLGNALMDISAGASVVEGLGRSLTLFLNPAVAVAAGVAITAGGAFYLLEQAHKKVEDAAKATEEAMKELSKTMEQQEKISEQASNGYLRFFETISDARDQLDLLRGSTTQYSIDVKSAERASRDLGNAQQEQSSKEYEAISEVILQRQKSINLLKEEIALQSGLFGSADVAKDKQNEVQELEKANKLDRERRENIVEQNVQTARQAYEYGQVLKQIAAVRKEERERAEAQRRADARRREEQAADREFERLFAEEEKKALERKNAQLALGAEKLKAQQQIQQILQQAQFSSLDTREQILARMNAEISRVRQLANTTGQRKTAEEAIKQIRANTKAELDDLNAKETENARILQEKLDKEKDITAEKEKQDKLDRRQQAADVFGAVTSLDAAGIVSMINPVVGSIMSSLMALGEKTPKQLREEARAQAEALANGLAILPTLLQEILPMLFVQLVEAIIDGVLNLLINATKNLIQGVNNLFRFRDVDPDGNNGREARQRRRRRAFRDFIDPTKSATYASGGRFLPRAAGGIRFTGSQDGLAMLHRGEFVVPQSGQRPQQVDRQMQSQTGGGVSININAAIVERNAVDALVRQIENRFNARFGVSSSNLFGGR